MDIRVGHGHDVHRLASGRRLVIGGVFIEHPLGLVGHSDADVLLHALIDALLGATGLGDIGEWFPDTDDQWAGADSATLLESTVGEIRSRGFGIVNLDCTIFAEKPKLLPHKASIRKRLAELLNLGLDAINVKAKTGEKVGPIGREEAIAADVVVLLARESEN